NRPHIHPRGTEAAYIVKGKNITMGFAPENGGKVVINNAGAGFASFFPQGYIHFQANNDCEPALLVAGLNHDDPGTITVVTQFFALPDGTVEAATGSADMQARRLRGELDLGTAPNLMKECRKRCGLDKGPGPQPPNGGGGAPRIQLADVKGQKTETGGVIGCFGINGINPNRLKEILQLTPNIGVFFYTAENCVRNTRINDGKPPQTAIGPVAPEVANADVKSLRLVQVNGGALATENQVQTPPSGKSSLQRSQSNGANNVQFLNVKAEKIETGGNIGCFGVNGINPFRLKEILRLSPNIGIFYYTAPNCVRATRIDDGQPPQKTVGMVPPNVANSDVKSIRIIPA
ncbi:hypothetical protein HDV02_004176, partial [Globomyces sp. JEL0801]